MKISRRLWLKFLGGAAIAGCSESVPLVPVDDDIDEGLDGGVLHGDEDEDLPPDEEVDANPPEDGDGGVEEEPDPEPDPDADGGTDAGTDFESDAGTDLDGGTDGGVPTIPDFVNVPERPARFPLGVMAGDATDTAIMFWTKFTGTAALTLRVYEMKGSKIVAVRFNGNVNPSAAGFVRVIVKGLRPNRVHRYAFLTGPSDAPHGRSAIGRARTAFAPDTLAPLRFAGTSCTNLNHAPLPVLKHAGSRMDLAFFIHAGDHVYADMGAGGAAVTRAEYRVKYERQWKIPGIEALHQSTALYKSWDDHEVFNNWNPETISNTRLNAARRAFFENAAIRRNATDPNRIWRSFRWGKTAEFFVLDCRSERLPSTRSANPANPSVYISPAQMQWLKDGLRTSPCVFKFIVNSVPIFNRPGPNGSGGDNWTSYASQRMEILRFITNRGLDAVVWLSGDVHYGGVTTVERSGPHRDIWEVIMGPSGANSRNPPNLDPAWWPARAVGVHNYTVLNADPLTRRLTVRYIDAGGNTINGGLWSHVF